MKHEYDVIVFGGGTAGTVAAIQAGRIGASTLLVEKNGILGGTMTLGGINAPAHFFAWGKQIIGGIGWELVRRTLEETGCPIPAPRPTQGPQDRQNMYAVTMDRGIYAALCDEAAIQAGVDLLFHAMPAAIAYQENGWTVTICTKTGLRKLRAKVLIDATGDANAVHLAGFEVVHPDVVQPATLQMYCSGYDPSTIDFDALRVAEKQAISTGELKSTDVGWYDNGPATFLHNHGSNANHLQAPHAETSDGKTIAELEARKAVLRMHRFFRKQPGLENFRVDWICSEAGIRETVTIKGKQTISVQDYEAGKTYEDAVCNAFYPIDEHLNDGKGINYRDLKPNTLPTIPRGALLPEGSRFLIVAGRCVSSDREANSGLRVACSCMAMGQAAGVMAALSAQSGVDPNALPLKDVLATLREQGAVVPEDDSTSGP